MSDEDRWEINERVPYRIPHKIDGKPTIRKVAQIILVMKGDID